MSSTKFHYSRRRREAIFGLAELSAKLWSLIHIRVIKCLFVSCRAFYSLYLCLLQMCYKFHSELLELILRNKQNFIQINSCKKLYPSTPPRRSYWQTGNDCQLNYSTLNHNHSNITSPLNPCWSFAGVYYEIWIAMIHCLLMSFSSATSHPLSICHSPSIV